MPFSSADTERRADRSLAASIAAHSKWAVTDPVQGTAAARAAFLSRFELLADPSGELDPAERARRAGHLRKAHFRRLALASAKARRGRRAAAS
jgi:hypothetical protein